MRATLLLIPAANINNCKIVVKSWGRKKEETSQESGEPVESAVH